MASRRVAAAGCLCLLAGLPATAEDLGFDVVVGLTPKAAETLSKTGEGVVVSAWYYADPKAGAEAEANPVGLIDVGAEELDLGPLGGPVRITGSGVRNEAFAWIGGPVYVNVNVWSARRSGPDNILDCDFFDGLLTRATAAPVELRCGLFEEDIPVQAKS